MLKTAKWRRFIVLAFSSAGGNFPGVGGHQSCKNVGKRQLPLAGLKSESTSVEGKALHAHNRASEQRILSHKL